MRTNRRFYYKNIETLRNSDVKFPYKEWHLEEIRKCANDVYYFFEHYAKVVDMDTGEEITFTPYPFQRNIIDTILKEKYVIGKIARQSGKTTVVAMIILWLITFKKYQRIAVLAQEADQAIEILTRIKDSYECLPLWIQQGVVKWDEKTIKLENKSQVMARATTGKSVRGKSVNFMFVDECAHIESGVMDEFLRGALPAISKSKSAKFITVSTPKGFNTFFRIWNNSKKKLNDFIRIEAHWSDVPDRDEAWAKDALRNICQNDKKMWAQEFECVAGDTVLRTIIDGFERTITIKEIYDRQLTGMVFTPTGFQHFHACRKVYHPSYITLKTYTGDTLTCSLNHKIITPTGNRFASSLQVNDVIFDVLGRVVIKEIETVHEKIELYDLVEVESGNVYYTNNILSHNCSFQGSSGTLIESGVLETLAPSDPIEMLSDEHLKVYERPSSNRTYFMTVDVGRGREQDYSAFSVFDVTEIPFKQVATYQRNDQISPVFTRIVNNMAIRFNECFVLVERNDEGSVVAELLWHEYEYENLVYSVQKLRKQELFMGMHPKGRIGLDTSKKTKIGGCTALANLIHQDKLHVQDSASIDELCHFVEDKTSYSAEEGYHDDLVMTLVLFAWASEQEHFKDYLEVGSVYKAMVEESEDETYEDEFPDIITSHSESHSPVTSPLQRVTQSFGETYQSLRDFLTSDR